MKLDRLQMIIRMDEAGLTGTELAKRAGISRATLSNGLRGINLSAETVEKVATALNTDPAAITQRDKKGLF